MSDPTMPPVLRDEMSAPFFDGTAVGEYRLRRCLDCGHVRAPEHATCTSCISESDEWFAAAGTGHVVSWVVLHSRAGADGVVPEPRVIATVELDEGPWTVNPLFGIDAVALTVGTRVHVDFVQPEGSEAIPVFRPV